MLKISAAHFHQLTNLSASSTNNLLHNQLLCVKIYVSDVKRQNLNFQKGDEDERKQFVKLVRLVSLPQGEL